MVNIEKEVVNSGKANQDVLEKGFTTSDLIGKVNATFTVIAAKPAVDAKDIDGQIVLAYRRLSGSYRGITAEYVTWLYSGQTKSYFYGHYATDFLTAVKDYEARN